MHCYVCDAYFPKEESKNHVRFHMNHHDGKIKCKICDHRSRNSYEYKQHMNLKHDNKFLKCNVQSCKKEFKSKNGLKYHLAKIHSHGVTLKCSKCDEEFVTTQKKDIHLRKVHDVGKFDCVYCTKSFSYKWTFDAHKCKAKPGRGFIHKCIKCKSFFKKKEYLNEHRKHCLNTRSYECSLCKKKFNHRSGLAYHIKKHCQ